MKELFLKIDYDIVGDVFCCESNIKKDRITDIVADFLRLQIDKGEDASAIKKQDLYQIDITLDLSCGKFKCTYNCGNLGLRDGILMHFLGKLKKKK